MTILARLNDAQRSIRRIDVSAELDLQLEERYRQSMSELVSPELLSVNFESGYRPDEAERCFISSFPQADEIISALGDPLSVAALEQDTIEVQSKSVEMNGRRWHLLG